MPEHKEGLHKRISAIFDGVSVPKDSIISPPPYAPQHPATVRQHGGQEHASAAATAVKPVPGKVEGSPVSDRQLSSPKSAPPAQQIPKDTKPQKPAGAVVKIAEKSSLQRIWEQVKVRFFAPKPGVSTVRQKVMMVLVPVLSIAFIFVFIRVFRAPASKAAKPPKEVKPSVVAVSDKKVDWKIPDLYPETLRDPMRIGSVTTPTGEGSTIVVRGIAYSEDNPAVIIGTQLMHSGDKVSGATIVRIAENEVEFEMNGKKWTQKVQQ